ncbi:MAG: DEAD/DEAH box helicase family protein [Phascolarctobacterium sp.]|nr:DEAD/DEAH box helicase family protein [Phascolarctobacterium sp.]
MLENIKLHLKPEGDGKEGIYLGVTGCGKTHVMLFLARMVGQRDNTVFKNPTVVLIVDRNDLDTQASELFVTAKRFLGGGEADVRSIDDRKKLRNTLGNRQSGGVYITTIQKFCESTWLLSDRSNIICISDEAHRTQTGIEAKFLKTDGGISKRYGFAKYLRDSFPNAIYRGFTWTPTATSTAVFGPVVDKYTMQESADDGITVHIVYEPCLARVVLSEEEAKEIQKYYEECANAGSTPAQILKSQKAMSRITNILNFPGRIEKWLKVFPIIMRRFTSKSQKWCRRP